MRYILEADPGHRTHDVVPHFTHGALPRKSTAVAIRGKVVGETNSDLSSVVHDSPLEQTACHWANQIAPLAFSRKTGVLDLGRVVYAARQALGYGLWSELWRSNDIPFRKRQGDKLRRIGEVLGRLDAHVCAQLPYGWRSAHRLLAEKQLGELIDFINAPMVLVERKD